MVSNLRTGGWELTRSRARHALIAAVFLALGGLGWVLGRTMASRQGQTPGEPARQMPAEVTQRIRDFRRVKVKDGRKTWELVALEAEVVAGRSEVVVVEPSVSFFGEDGRSAVVSGKEGRVFLAGSDVQRIELGGGIEVRVSDYVVRTDSATWVQAEDSVSAPGKVTVDGDAMSLVGDGMLVELGRQRLQFQRGVRTTLRHVPGAPAAGGGAIVPSPGAPATGRKGAAAGAMADERRAEARGIAGAIL